ncbi:MAG TPA: DNA mismatch repair protein MutS [Gammaproteobacteria bacterium]|nr:DNA mismatch repair protein MutS [Gammaproteobacteria bacterium]
MVSRKDRPSPEDIAIFRETVGPVKRLRQERVEGPRRRPPPRPLQRQADERRVMADLLSDHYDPAEVETGEELLYARPGVQRSLLRRLRRGQFAVRAELDLHGMTVPMAREALQDFLRECAARDLRCVRIIHGKGRRSPGRRPVLKGRLDVWLRQWDGVLAYCSARPVDGGSGALYVLLRRSR